MQVTNPDIAKKFFNMALSIGAKAPEFSVADQDGNIVKLSKLKGQKVVLFFYPKDMTPGCTAEACNLRDNYKLLLKHGYQVFGVSTDSEKSHQKFIAKEKLPFSLLADTDKKLHESYGTWVEKSMYGRKYMGTARTTFIINESGIVEDIIEKVDTKNHTDQILGKETPISKPSVAKKVTATSSQVKKLGAKKTSPKKK